MSIRFNMPLTTLTMSISSHPISLGIKKCRSRHSHLYHSSD
ncbi:Uncharacterised protein [Vibrio cholerae]|nr:Uncharacterised protein [Vibrio cholerae]